MRSKQSGMLVGILLEACTDRGGRRVDRKSLDGELTDEVLLFHLHPQRHGGKPSSSHRLLTHSTVDS